jgi:glycosidase
MVHISFERKEGAYFPFGFPVSHEAGRRYDLAHPYRPGEETDARREISALRRLAHKINLRRDFSVPGTQPVRAGQLMALGLHGEVLRYVWDRYTREEVPGSLTQGVSHARDRRGSEDLERQIRVFVQHFPPQAVSQGTQTPAGFIEGRTDDQANREAAAREASLLALAMSNPALKPYRELFDDAELKGEIAYNELVDDLEAFFETQPPLDPAVLPLFEFLRAPARAYPDSLEDQLEYMRRHWGAWLPPGLLERLLRVKDVLREETMMRGIGPGETFVLDFRRAGAGPEPERFTQDRDWMSNLVLIAKSTYVWLDQMSKKYQRHISRLDQVPDEELDRLARWGFTGLWLIGVWERSPASQRIKQWMGNPEAVSSAYSLYDYVVAGDLGGEEAYENLRDRAWRRGIRLASDMVPNHVGIYSKWLVEHPDWFIQLDYPPYPSYSFTCENLADDGRVLVQIEDGYWSHRDAAVVFKRTDTYTGHARYIYHGNDGTSMPWNDTAQLNYLNPEVREAAIQTILHVARKFPIIRFDAAMTLSKRHYQRLWFPAPGEGGAIPSRAEHGMTKEEFDRAMPEEFWREVVDRIQQDAPDTLLLAEAFWLMEGYFVRTLGMHRVYNSAFMNMLKMEDNAKYRQTLRNVLEFSPEVLKRFVNFMNNPDEQTAVEQFGRGDKYYGVALLMVTMPGLPMFGHGQIEGFTEKYGMEYRRAYWDEQIDEHMVWRHETEIFPLMSRRHLFSGVAHFALYDFQTAKGWVDENVFAYSNRAGADRAVILYNNAYNTTQGWIRLSTAINIAGADHPQLVRRTLAESLALRADENVFYVFRNYRTNLEYIRSGRQLTDEGLFVELGAYQYHAFLDFREVYDSDGTWRSVADRLEGSGSRCIEDAHKEVVLDSVLRPFREVVNSSSFETLQPAGKTVRLPDAWSRLEPSFVRLLDEMRAWVGHVFDQTAIVAGVRKDMALLGDLENRINGLDFGAEVTKAFLAHIEPDVAYIPVSWAILRHLENLFEQRDPELRDVHWMDDWMFMPILADAFAGMGIDSGQAYADALLVKTLIRNAPRVAVRGLDGAAEMAQSVLEDYLARDYLLVNEYGGVLWVNRERIQSLADWLCFTGALLIMEDEESTPETCAARILRRHEGKGRLLRAAADANYQAEKTLTLLKQGTGTSQSP